MGIAIYPDKVKRRYVEPKVLTSSKKKRPSLKKGKTGVAKIKSDAAFVALQVDDLFLKAKKFVGNKVAEYKKRK